MSNHESNPKNGLLIKEKKKGGGRIFQLIGQHNPMQFGSNLGSYPHSTMNSLQQPASMTFCHSKWCYMPPLTILVSFTNTQYAIYYFKTKSIKLNCIKHRRFKVQVKMLIQDIQYCGHRELIYNKQISKIKCKDIILLIQYCIMMIEFPSPSNLW